MFTIKSTNFNGVQLQQVNISVIAVEQNKIVEENSNMPNSG